MTFLKRLAAALPGRWQSELKKRRFARQIRNGTFATDEPEYAILPDVLQPGDWVLDVGANVGHYTKRFSDLVGPHGRVVAFEPVPETFAILAANSREFEHENVTLINAAASDSLNTVAMSIPRFDTGLDNFYMAHIESGPHIESGHAEAGDPSGLSVLSLPVDALGMGDEVALVKIDAEGHEASVLEGMQGILERAKPVLIVETESEGVIAQLTAKGYDADRLDGSPNVLFTPNGPAQRAESLLL